jgi:hypothetical protein
MNIHNMVGYRSPSKVIWKAFSALVSSSGAEKLKFNFSPSSSRRTVWRRKRKPQSKKRGARNRKSAPQT